MRDETTSRETSQTDRPWRVEARRSGAGRMPAAVAFAKDVDGNVLTFATEQEAVEKVESYNANLSTYSAVSYRAVRI